MLFAEGRVMIIAGPKFVGEKLLLKAFRKYMTSRGLRTLCNGSETQTEWKSESVTD